MELSPICKKEYPALRALYRSAFPAAERMPLPRFFALQKKGASGNFGAAHRRRLCRADDRHLCPRLRPAQLLCRGAGLPLYGTWFPGAARLAAALSQSAGGAGGGAAGSYGTQRPAAATAAGFLCQKRLSLPATCRYGCAAWHWMCSRPAGRHWILPPIKGFIARSLAVWRPFLCKSANKTPPGQILLVFWPGVV